MAIRSGLFCNLFYCKVFFSFTSSSSFSLPLPLLASSPQSVLQLPPPISPSSSLSSPLLSLSNASPEFFGTSSNSRGVSSSSGKFSRFLSSSALLCSCSPPIIYISLLIYLSRLCHHGIPAPLLAARSFGCPTSATEC